MKRNTRIIIVSILIALMGLYLFRSKFSKSSKRVSFEEPSRDVPALLFFYADWCGYCDQFKPEWAKVEQILGNNPNIQLVKINGDERKDLMEQFQVQGFPTVVLVTGQGPIPYDGPRTSEGIMDFLNNLA